jgi:hypothetical protein
LTSTLLNKKARMDAGARRVIRMLDTRLNAEIFIKKKHAAGAPFLSPLSFGRAKERGKPTPRALRLKV